MRDHNYGIPYDGSSSRSCQSIVQSIWQSICESLYPPPQGGETGVCLPSSPSNISIKKSAPISRRSPSVIIPLFLMLVVLCTPVVGADDTPPPITLELDHDEADTWSSVLVIIRLPAILVNNTTSYYIDREVRLSLVDLDENKVLVMVNVNVTAGIGVFNFRILPDWGEFLMEVKALDHNLSGASAVVRLKVVYSTDWIIYELSRRYEDIARGMREDSAASNLLTERMEQIMFLIVFVLLTVALLRVEHRAARNLGRSSWWDRFWDKSFNYTLTPGLYHYLEDDAYGFSTVGRKRFRRLRLEFGQEMVQVDMAALKIIDGKFEAEIDRLTEKPQKSENSEKGKKGKEGNDTETTHEGHAS